MNHNKAICPLPTETLCIIVHHSSKYFILGIIIIKIIIME